MGDDWVQKPKDSIDAWTAQQVEMGDQTGAAQTNADQPQAEPMDAAMDRIPNEGSPQIAVPVDGDAGVETASRMPQVVWPVTG